MGSSLSIVVVIFFFFSFFFLLHDKKAVNLSYSDEILRFQRLIWLVVRLI